MQTTGQLRKIVHCFVNMPNIIKQLKTLNNGYQALRKGFGNVVYIDAFRSGKIGNPQK